MSVKVIVLAFWNPLLPNFNIDISRKHSHGTSKSSEALQSILHQKSTLLVLSVFRLGTLVGVVLSDKVERRMEGDGDHQPPKSQLNRTKGERSSSNTTPTKRKRGSRVLKVGGVASLLVVALSKPSCRRLHSLKKKGEFTASRKMNSWKKSVRFKLLFFHANLISTNTAHELVFTVACCTCWKG